MIIFRENGITLTGYNLDAKENTYNRSSITIDYNKIIYDKGKRINEFVNKYSTMNKTFVVQDNIKEFNEKVNKENKNLKVGEYKLNFRKNDDQKAVFKRPREDSIKYVSEESLSRYIKQIESFKRDIKEMENELKSLNKKKKRRFPVLPVTEEKNGFPGTKYYSINADIGNMNQVKVNRYQFDNDTDCYKAYISDNFFRTEEEANKVVNSYSSHIAYEFKKKKILNAIIRYTDKNGIDKTYSDYHLPFTYNQVVSILRFIEDNMYGRYDNKTNHMIYMIERMDGDKIRIIQSYYPQFNTNSTSIKESNNAYGMLHDLITNALATGDGSKIFFSRKEAVNSYTVRNWKKIFPNVKVDIIKL